MNLIIYVFLLPLVKSKRIRNAYYAWTRQSMMMRDIPLSLFCPSPGAEAEFYHPFTRLYRSLHCLYNWLFRYSQVHWVYTSLFSYIYTTVTQYRSLHSFCHSGTARHTWYSKTVLNKHICTFTWEYRPIHSTCNEL